MASLGNDGEAFGNKSARFKWVAETREGTVIFEQNHSVDVNVGEWVRNAAEHWYSSLMLVINEMHWYFVDTLL